MSDVNETPESLRAEAKELSQKSRESFDRSDTDGFLSQWALDITAREKRMKADLIERGGVIETTALFDTKGNLIPHAREVETRYGWAWVHDDENGTHWFNPSKAQKAWQREANNAKKGYYLGLVKVKATVRMCGSGTGLSGAANAYIATVPLKNQDGSMIIMEVIDNGINSPKIDAKEAREKCETANVHNNYDHDDEIERWGHCVNCGTRYYQVS